MPLSALLWVGTEAPFVCTPVGWRHDALATWLRDGAVPWSVRLAALLLWAVTADGACDDGERKPHPLGRSGRRREGCQAPENSMKRP